MPESARILRFPGRDRAIARPQAEVCSLAHKYLSYSPSERPDSLRELCLTDPDVLLAICKDLAVRTNSSPTEVASESESLYQSLVEPGSRVGVFDDKAYLLGETALLAAAGSRLSGRRETAELWLDKADANFRHTISPAASLARVSLERLALHFDARRYDRVLAAVPELIRSFEVLGMVRQVLKSRFLEALSLKDLGKIDQALDRLALLGGDPAIVGEVTIHGMVVAHQAELLAATGRLSEATELLNRALATASFSDQPMVSAQLKVTAAQYFREQDKLSACAELLRSAIADYTEIRMNTQVAYLRIVVAEVLLALSRNREAEWEILAALPTLEEAKMLPEGLMAVALLRDSVRRRDTDHQALRQLREQLQSKD